MKKTGLWVCFFLLFLGTTEAQLLEDTDKKLNSAKIARKGFLFFGSKRKVENSTAPKAGKTKRAPRYSSTTSPFRLSRGGVSPRYSKPQEKARKYAPGVRTSGGIVKFKSVASAPRSTGGSPFRNVAHNISPRFSRGRPFGSQKKAVVTRSAPNPFRGVSHKVVSKNSAGNPFRGKSYNVSPRFTQRISFDTGKGNTSVRYSNTSKNWRSRFVGNQAPVRTSGGIPFRNERFNVSPRFSQRVDFSAGRKNTAIRYSTTSKDYRFRFSYEKTPIRSAGGNPFRGVQYDVRPRFSAGIPFRNVKYNVQPRFSDTKTGSFLSNQYTLAKRYQRVSLWSGGAESERAQFWVRQWEKLWAKLNGTAPTTTGVKNPGRKAKFDKKERVIWNN